MIARISASFLGGTVRQCGEMAVNTALIRVSGVIAAYRQRPADQLGTLSQKAYFGRSFGFVREFGFNLFQADREGDKG